MRLPALAVLLLCLAGLAGPAVAVDAADRSAIRRVIDGQLQALRRDDADGAYAYASPGVQGMFPSADRFMSMVEQGYKPVYKSRSHAFGALRETEAGLFQSVRVKDADGVDWTALYALEKQPDGTWKISGCQIVREPGESV